MKILIVGISGYIGLPLAAALLRRNHAITGLDTGYFSKAALYSNDITENVMIVKKDVREITREDVTGYNAVLHLGELSNDP